MSLWIGEFFPGILFFTKNFPPFSSLWPVYYTTNSLFVNAFISELSRFIANGRLHATIDKVHGIVETTRPSLRNAQYETVVKRGDVLLNSVQRLSKVLY